MIRHRRKLVALAALAVSGIALGACAYNEALGRSQFLIVDNASMIQQSNAAWAEAVRTQNVTTTGAQVDRIRRVGSKLVQAARLDNRTWDYAVFTNTSPNAFVLPSGQIGVTTGLLSLVQNDDQLAAVIGHEIAHVVANHAAERSSSQAVTSIGLQLGQRIAGDYGQAVGAYGGLAAQYGVLLPYSRRDELEADRLGVDYVQAAGWRPSQSVALWRLMAAQRQTATPQFASTHPSDATRITALEQYIASRGWS
ncbi:M48 family metallopeptidase [Brevundimonas nasdae]|uniref:M48 family metallopeptidase n=1 Tax=Brevundimonas nasdae TaxID=172043 RepID=A0ABX8TGW7_9CAUL|nr:M48 family metallopeptidase [Brevundimonas nasdae]QYC10032.1 M48 family metallopeptidase [Brevundimonas nasdae]QYC12822.1 M48 family metallopeptidase [Brevundimonas nasdae]